jgi:hypothetical protein
MVLSGAEAPLDLDQGMPEAWGGAFKAGKGGQAESGCHTKKDSKGIRSRAPAHRPSHCLVIWRPSRRTLCP